MDGSLYTVGNTCYLKFYTIEAGERVHKTVKLCQRSDVFSWWKKRGKWGYSTAVRALQRTTMDKVKADTAQRVAALTPAQSVPGDMTVVKFWETHYLPYIEAIVPLTGMTRRKPSTTRGFKQIWNQHLRNHFSTTTLKDYEPSMGKRLLRSLTATQGKTTLKHIKALAGSIFGFAVDEEFIKVNPWHDVKIPDDAIESAATAHYTLSEVEIIISSLVDHVDCQLVLALACFLGLRPGELAALKWEDFDIDTVTIRRSVVRGIVGTPKTLESLATLPLPAQVIVPLELWRRKCSESGDPSGYVFNSRENTPVDLHNMIARVIKPHVNGGMKCISCDLVPQASGAKWKSLYAGRRCAATAVIESNNGNLAIGQALLRHKSQITTAAFYKKAVSPATLKAGMKNLELAAKNG
jgi:integrase